MMIAQEIHGECAKVNECTCGGIAYELEPNQISYFLHSHKRISNISLLFAIEISSIVLNFRLVRRFISFHFIPSVLFITRRFAYVRTFIPTQTPTSTFECQAMFSFALGSQMHMWKCQHKINGEKNIRRNLSTKIKVIIIIISFWVWKHFIRWRRFFTS